MEKNKITKAVIFTGLWSVLLIPFFVSHTMYFPYITGKNFSFRIIVEIIFALWIYLAYVDQIYRPKFSKVLGAVGLFVLIMAVADLFAVAPVKAFFSNFERMDGWLTLIHLLMYLLVFGSVMKTEKIWLVFFRSSVLASMIMIVFVIQEWLKTGTSRVSVTLGNPIYVAVYFLFNFFFVLILLYKDVIIKAASSKLNQAKSIFSNWLTYLYFIAAFLCAFGIWRTSTRGVILGLLGGLIITSLTVAFFEKENRLLKKFSVGALIVIAIIIGGFFAIRDTQFVKNSVTLSRFAGISWSSIAGQGQARQLVWPMAIKGFQEKPILGWGQEGFNYVFNKYYDPRMYNQEQWFDRAHNMPLDMLIAGGLLGLLSYLLIFVSAVYLAWKRRNVLGVADAGLLIGLLAGYFFQNLFVFDNLISYVFFFVVLSYIHSKDVENSSDSVKSQKQTSKTNLDAANYMVAPIIIIVFGLSLWYFNLRPISGNFNLIKAMQRYQEGPTKNLEYFKTAVSKGPLGTPEVREQILSITGNILSTEGGDPKTKQAFVDFAYAQIQEQLKQTPNDARYQFFAGTFLDGISQYQMALPYLEKSLELSPNKQTMMFELAKSLMYLGQKDKAVEITKRAYDLLPEFEDARYQYIAALIVKGNDSLARQLLGSETTTSDIVVRGYLIRATEYLQKGDKNSAIFEVQRAIKIAPGFKNQGEEIIKQISGGGITG